MTTLDEARLWLEERRDDGAHCPCCGQFAKVYRRKIHCTMAADLIKFYQRQAMEFGHVATVISRGERGVHLGDFAKLSYWGLIEERDEKRDDGGHAGWWRVTEPGKRFVLDHLRVQKYALVYDGACLGMKGDPVSITDALGDKFSYEELMAGV